MASLFGLIVWAGQAQGCEEKLLQQSVLQPAMSSYFKKLRQARWEGIQPFDHIEGQRIYLTSAFDRLSAPQKKHILSLLLLEYGEYKPLVKLLPSVNRLRLERSGGTMSPYEVYTADGRLVSLPYNACNRMTLLTEHDRSRLASLGFRSKRVQRYPMSRWQQERVKKLFWQAIGYERAGDYWISWVPEIGRFEIDVPSLNHNTVLDDFWQVAPDYYRYVVLDRSRPIYSHFKGRRIQG
jgi:hypothetical protein